MPATRAALLLVAGILAGCREDAPRDVLSSGPNTHALVFVKSDGEETLNRSRAESNLYLLRPIAPDGVVTPLTAYTGGSAVDPCVSFDGRRILFSLRPPGGSHWNIWEMDVDGRNLRQVTAGGGDDFDPLYLPNGRILFTSSRAGEMDEYNFSPAEQLYVCDMDGSGIERVSFNMSDDFDPMLMKDGRIAFTRWEHFGTMNRFPLFFANPDGTKAFHLYGPHDRNFFHAQATPDGRIVCIESTEVNEDAGPIAILKLETGPADPVRDDRDHHWNVLTDQVNNDGAPWTYGAFKYPFPLGGNDYVVSYTLPAATDEDVDYGLYTFSVNQDGDGTEESPATISLRDLVFLYNDPATNEYDAQLVAPYDPPPVLPTLVDHSQDSGVFLASDVYNRSDIDGQETPERGVDLIDRLLVLTGIPTRRGESGDHSANDFDRRAILGFAPVYPDGSFKIRVPADVPIAFATLDQQGRALVTKRTWIYVRPGELVDECTGCHKDRGQATDGITNPNPFARSQPASDLNVAPDDYTFINWETDIGPIVAAKCTPCHVAPSDSIPAPANLDLSAALVPDRRQRLFPRAYLNLCGEPVEDAPDVVVPAFPRRSVLVDAVLGVDSHAATGPHPDPSGPYALTDREKELINLWVALGAQYR